MYSKNLSYTEIQNLRIQAEIDSFKSGQDHSIYDVIDSRRNPVTSRQTKPLPVFIADHNPKPTKPSNVNMRIRLRNLNEFTTYNFLLVKESTLVNPDKNIISVESPLGKILQYAQVGEAFTCNDEEYSILDISPTPKTRVQAG
jgi:hypothetical protein